MRSFIDSHPLKFAMDAFGIWCLPKYYKFHFLITKYIYETISTTKKATASAAAANTSNNNRQFPRCNGQHSSGGKHEFGFDFNGGSVAEAR